MRRIDLKVSIFIGAVMVTMTMILCGHAEKMKAYDVQIIEVESFKQSPEEVTFKLPPKEEPKIEYKPDPKELLQQEIRKEFTKNKPMKW